MKMKRKQQTNGVKSSNSDSKSETKTDLKLNSKDSKSDKLEFKIENSKPDQLKSETTKTDQQNNKLTDKKDKMSVNVNGTSNGSFTNGLSTTIAINDVKNKVTNNSIKGDSKTLSLKEKKKTNSTASSLKSLESNRPSSQANQKLNLLNENENSKDNEINKQLINDKLSNCEKNDDKTDKLNSTTSNLSNDKSASNISISSNLISSLTEITNKPLSENSNSDLTFKSELFSKKRELDSSPTNGNKKAKTENNVKTIETKEASTATNSVSTMTEHDCIGFVEPGTSVVLCGAVLDEIEGVLVVNVTWRGRTYVGTLLDCTKNEWAPPRFFCESPTSDLESRGGISRKRKRSRGSISESENNIKLQSKLRNGKGRRNFTVPASPVRNNNSSSSSGQQEQSNNNSNKKGSNSSKSDNAIKQRSSPPLDSNSNSTSSPATATTNSNSSSTVNSQSNQTTSSNNKNQASSPIVIKCPEPNCNKKYKHINGLKYHQTHAHHDSVNNGSKASNSSSNANNNTNKSDEQNESNKENEETTDIEDSVDNEIQLNSKTNKPQNKSSKFSNKQTKENRSDSNKSPAAYSDISDTENDSSRPSSNNSNSQSTSQLTNDNSSAKNEDLNLSSSDKLTCSTSLNKSASSTFPFLFSSDSSATTGKDLINNLDDTNNLSKEDQKTNEELRKLASEVDQKLSNDSKLNDSVQQQLNNNNHLSPNNKLLLNSPKTGNPILSNHTPVLPSSKTPNNAAAMYPTAAAGFPGVPMDPALHAYLMQTDLNHRINYERYLIEHQEKLLSSLTPNELNEIERQKALFFAQQQHNAALANLNNFTNLNQISQLNGKDSVFKLPSNTTRPSSTKSNSERSSLTTNSSSSGGGSIVNGTSLAKQQETNNSSASKNPYDFQESEKQFEKQREEIFKLNSFRMEEQRLLNSRTPMPNHRSNSSPSKKSLTPKDEHHSNNLAANKTIMPNESIKHQFSSSQPTPTTNFLNFPAPYLNSSTIAQTSLANFSTTSSVHPHLSFDPNAFHQQTGNNNAQMLTSLPQPFINPLIDSLMFANAGLSHLDLNNVNASKQLLTAANQQQTAAHMLNNGNIKKTDLVRQDRNGLSADKLTSNEMHRNALTANLSQNSSSTLLNTSNNSNLSTSSKKDLDENRSPSRHLNNLSNAQHVGFPAQFIDPYGELIQQAASATCLVPPYAVSK